MKISQTDGKLVASPDLVKHNFRINTSKKAFEILSSGLYSDKVTAIIRELSTNAADSHKEAGQTKPFEVHLPNTLETYFYVRDFGTGLSDAAIHTLYTTYFESNRTDSDDFTGGLGLGSKSPFSYIDQFSVVSRYSGTETHYSCFIDDHGIPTVTKLQSVPTTEINGLEVKFPVKPNDVQEFRSRAQTVLSLFEPKPVVTGWSGFHFEIITYAQQNQDYGLRNSYQGFSRVIMGNVGYRIDDSDFKADRLETELLQYGVDIFMPVGSVEVAANREKLSYTKHTVSVLKDKIKVILEEIRKKTLTSLDQAKTVWEARQLLHVARASFMGKFLPSTVKFQGKDLQDSFRLDEYRDSPVVVVIRSGYGRHAVRTEANPWAITADQTKIYIDDLPTGGVSRTEYLIESKAESRVYLIKSTPVKPDPTKAKLPPFSETGMLEAAIKTSTLAKPPTTSRVAYRSGLEKAKLLVLKDTFSGRNNKAWEPADTELANGGVYVEISRFIGANSIASLNIGPSSLARIRELLDKLGYKIKLFGIRPADKKKLEKHKTKWVHLHDYIKDVVSKENLLVEQARAVSGYLGLGQSAYIMGLAKYKFVAGSKMGKLVNDTEQAKAWSKNDKIEAVRQLCQYIGLITSDDTSKLEKVREELYQEYTLLNYINWYALTTDKKIGEAISAYINSMDGAGHTKLKKPIIDGTVLVKA